MMHWEPYKKLASLEEETIADSYYLDNNVKEIATGNCAPMSLFDELMCVFAA
jgi:hypothetical protein